MENDLQMTVSIRMMTLSIRRMTSRWPSDMEADSIDMGDEGIDMEADSIDM